MTQDGITNLFVKRSQIICLGQDRFSQSTGGLASTGTFLTMKKISLPLDTVLYIPRSVWSVFSDFAPLMVTLR